MRSNEWLGSISSRQPVVSADDDHDDEEDAGDGDRDKEDNEGRHMSTSYV